MQLCFFSVSPYLRVSCLLNSDYWLLITHSMPYALCLPQSAIRNPQCTLCLLPACPELVAGLPPVYFLLSSSSRACIATVVEKTLDFSPANCNRMLTNRGRIPSVSSALLSH